MGNRTAVKIGSETTSYTFDEMNRLKTVTDPDGGMTTYSYDKNGNRESVIYPNGTVAEYTYDSLNRLTKLFNRKANGDTISCYEYTLGLAGNRTRVEEHTGRTVDYSYDDTYKLTGEIIDDPVFGTKTISYTYDAVGNRLTKTEDGVVTSYVYDDNDRLLSETSASGNTTYSYDDNGNTLSKTSPTENISYGYDYNNRLISVDDGTDLIAYAYDTDGMRVQKTVNGSVTKYLLDKNRDYAQVLKEFDGSGNTIVSYTYGDDLISQNRNSSLSYYHYDGQLSTRQLTDASALVTDEYTYDAFGLLLNRSGSTLNNYMYTGEQYDPNVGFYYLRARYYNPTIGRFHTMDTWPGMQFEPMSLHKYLYCESGPVGAWDLSGEFSLKEFIMVNHLYAWLCTTIINVLMSSIAFLVSKKNDAEWNGGMFSVGFSSMKSFGVNIGIAYYHGSRETEDGPKEGSGLWLIIVFGHHSTYFNEKGEKKVDFSWSYSTPAWFKSPGAIGLKRGALSGLISWSSVGFNIPKGFGTTGKLKYIGIVGSVMFMGWGISYSFGAIGGSKGLNLELMGGLSIPLKFWGGE